MLEPYIYDAVEDLKNLCEVLLRCLFVNSSLLKAPQGVLPEVYLGQILDRYCREHYSLNNLWATLNLKYEQMKGNAPEYAPSALLRRIMSMSFKILYEWDQPALLEVLLIVIVVCPSTIKKDVDALEAEEGARGTIMLEVENRLDNKLHSFAYVNCGPSC